MSRFLAVLVLLVLAACAPSRQELGRTTGSDRIVRDFAGTFFVTSDGVRLPLRTWLPEDKPKAVIVALHGMNDHSRSFELPAEAWRKAGIATYAYDQRGFGGSPQRGIWPGREILVRDLKAMAAIVRARHPGVPFYLLGNSMGGAVVMMALGGANPPAAAGTILVAPAVWSRETMPALFPAATWLAAHTIPEMKVTSDDVRRQATDNIPLLRQLAKDPRFIKATRVDAGYGVSRLMDEAVKAAPRIRGEVLLLYGERDEIIRKPAMRLALGRLKSGPADLRAAYYITGWHMLLRDKNREVVHRDVVAWITKRAKPLPSWADKRIGLLAAGK